MSKEQKPVAWRYENKNVKGNWYITWTEPPDGFNKRPLYESQDANRIEELERERDALQADNARLRDALEVATNYSMLIKDAAIIQYALATTPEQSLAAYRNKVIEECALICDKRAMRKNDGNWTNDEWDSICGTNELAADEIRAMKEQP